MSVFDDIMRRVGVPAIERVFGDPATYTDGNGDDYPVSAIAERRQVDVGEYGPLSETQWIISVASGSIPHPEPGHTIAFAAGLIAGLTGGDPSEPETFTVRMIAPEIGGDGLLWALAVTRNDQG